eukprot:COSAG06_NODE_4158_length_4512_cov_4.141400_3_plen_109_part_00
MQFAVMLETEHLPSQARDKQTKGQLKKGGNTFWLSDLADGKQDAIPVFAAQAFGPERVSDLAKAAEAAEDWWLASLRWSASALSGGKTGFEPFLYQNDHFTKTGSGKE